MQEAFSHLAEADIGSFDDPEGWLVVVISRLGFERLRVRQRRPTDSMEIAGELRDANAIDPSSRITLADNVRAGVSVRGRRYFGTSSWRSRWRCTPSWNA